MLEDIKVGDRVVNDLGEESTVVDVKVFDIGRTRLRLNPPITGWIDDWLSKSWSYERDGKFVRDPNDKKASNLVKVLKHG